MASFECVATPLVSTMTSFESVATPLVSTMASFESVATPLVPVAATSHAPVVTPEQEPHSFFSPTS